MFIYFLALNYFEAYTFMVFIVLQLTKYDLNSQLYMREQFVGRTSV